MRKESANAKNVSKDLRVLLTDTSNLWAVDSFFWDQTHRRAEECLAGIVDAIIDPRVTLRCLFQHPELIGETKQKTPNSHKVLKDAGLLTNEDQKTAKDYETELTPKVMSEFLNVMSLWAKEDPKNANSFRELHRDNAVIDLDRYKTLSEDERVDAIPPVIYEFCKGQGNKNLNEISEMLNWSEVDSAFIYSILIRAIQYECISHQLYPDTGQYFSHPARRLPACHKFKVDPVSPAGANVNRLGGKIVRAWLDTAPDNLSLLIDWVSSAREKCTDIDHLNFLDGHSTTPKRMEEIIRHILSPIPAQINANFIKSILVPPAGWFLETQITGNEQGWIGGIMGVLLTKFIYPEWVEMIVPKLPGRAANLPLIRSVVVYPDIVSSKWACVRCGTESQKRPCPVCKYENKLPAMIET